jgi:hypothetical protein
MCATDAIPPAALAPQPTAGLLLTVLGAQRRQQRVALDQRASRLHQVVHDDHVPALGHALLEAHDALAAVAHLCADDLWVALVLELVVEALPGTLVGVRDGDLWGEGSSRGVWAGGLEAWCWEACCVR